MISVAPHVKINVVTIFLYAFSTVFYYPPVFYITYASIILHECAHMTAAIILGLKVDYIALMPFGANLRLKNSMVYSLAEDIILYMSGPFFNAIIAAISVLVFRQNGNYLLRTAYISNVTLFAVNLIPAMPLDGGAVSKRLLTHAFGFKVGSLICTILSAIVFCVFAVLGIYAVIISRNISVLMFSALIFGNIFASKAMYDAGYTKYLAVENRNKSLS